MQLLEKKILCAELKTMSEKMFGDFVKAVVDIEKNIMVVDADMHADLEAYLVDLGSKQENVWGINLYPDKFGTDEFVEFNSMINVRPSQNNRTRGVDNPAIRKTIISIINRWTAQ